MNENIYKLIEEKGKIRKELKTLRNRDREIRLEVWNWIKSHKYWAEWLAHLTGGIPDPIKKIADMNVLPKDFDIYIDGNRFSIDLYRPEDPRKGWIYVESAPIKYLEDDEIEKLGSTWLENNQDKLKEEISCLDKEIEYCERRKAEAEKKRLEFMKYVKDMEE